MDREKLSSSENPNKCEDAISRQAVLDLIYNSWKHNGVGENYGELSIDALKALPPVTPKQKMGRWIKVTNGRGGHECSLCHKYAPSYKDGDEWLTQYCPDCGAKMAESEESNG